MSTRELVLTELDLVRLNRLLGARHDPALAERVEAAAIVPVRAIQPDVVTMNSRVSVAPVQGEDPVRDVTLTWPEEGASVAGGVSVLSPLGRELLGSRIGDEIDVLAAAWRAARIRVAAIRYQPEASRHLTR